jgi:hypothetical protein
LELFSGCFNLLFASFFQEVHASSLDAVKCCSRCGVPLFHLPSISVPNNGSTHSDELSLSALHRSGARIRIQHSYLTFIFIATFLCFVKQSDLCDPINLTPDSCTTPRHLASATNAPRTSISLRQSVEISGRLKSQDIEPRLNASASKAGRK